MSEKNENLRMIPTGISHYCFVKYIATISLTYNILMLVHVIIFPSITPKFSFETVLVFSVNLFRPRLFFSVTPCHLSPQREMNRST